MPDVCGQPVCLFINRYRFSLDASENFSNFMGKQAFNMIPSFFALFSKAGIACAADTDHTIYRLSDKLPLALAVNPESPIPWDKLIGEYKQTNPQEKDFFANYANEFSLFLASLEVEEPWKNLTQQTANIIFFGFGKEDIYPSVFDVMVQVSDEGVLEFGEAETHCVSQLEPVFFHMQGDFESVSTLLFGATRKTREFFVGKHTEQFEEYSRRVMEKFDGTEYEDYVTQHLAAFDAEEEICRIINNATEKSISELSMGVDAFSVEEMVTAVESIVNANAKLSHLHSGAKGKYGETKEIAVMTIPEGLTWIKHSVYNRRTEI